MQRELLKGYESNQLSYASIRSIKRLMDQRRLIGKQRDTSRAPVRTRTSAEALVNAFKRETQRQRKLVKKANCCEAKLLFIVKAFTSLLADENFVTLLRAEALSQMPKYLHNKLQLGKGEP
jgi:ParB family chromosome partitioning protein